MREASVEDVLLDIVLRSIYFFASANDDVIDEDAAVRELENIANMLLSRLSNSQKAALVEKIGARLANMRASTEPSTRERRAWEEFLVHLPANIGLSPR